MRLLIVGADEVHAIENFYFKYIRAEGVEVNLLPAHRIFNEYYYKNIYNKLRYKLGISDILKKINCLVKETVESFQPEIILVFKGMELSAETLTWVKGRNIKLVNYNPDNPFIFTGKGSGNENIKACLPLYDLHFTYNREIEKQLKADLSARTSFLPFGYDIPENVCKEESDQPEMLKLCFLGNPDTRRAYFLKQLAEKGVTMDVYGNHWHKFIAHPGITIFPPVYETELWKVLRRYRIQLNMMRMHNENSHNMRSFEVPAIGGIMLAPDTVEHRLFFEDGEEVFLYKNIGDCIERSRYILDLPGESAAQIRSNAALRCVQSGYSYKERARQVIRELELLR